MPGAESPDIARAAFDDRDWALADASYLSRDRQRPLSPEDLERWATCAYLLGDDARSVELLTRAHHALLTEDPVGAARMAFWIAFNLLNRGEMAQGGGWLGRAQRVLEETGQPECAVHGYLLLPRALQELESGDARTSVPGLYFSGLAFQFGFASMLVYGADSDAEYVANHIDTRHIETRSPQPSSQLRRRARAVR